jgi:HlyD family secretion protein
MLLAGFAVVSSITLIGCAKSGSAADERAPRPAVGAPDGVSALGRIEPEHGLIRLGVPSMPEAINGSVVRTLNVEVGDDVTSGQLLAETDATHVQEASVKVATADLDLAERRAEQAVGQEQEACSRADVAGRTSTRMSKLLKTGAVSIEGADQASGDAKALSGSCASARTATRAAQSSVEVGRAHLAYAQAALERTYVRAPANGRVLQILKRPGELVDAGGILEMGRVDRMCAIAEIYETDIGRVRVGQRATVTSSALDGPLGGSVERVRPKVRKQDATGTDPAARKDARIVEVEVLLDDPAKVAALTNLQVEVVIRP